MERLSLSTGNLLDENVERLAELWPDVVTEVREPDGTLRHTIDVDALRERVGDVAEGQRERYQFTWPGKREAKQEAYRAIDKCLRPCPEESVDWDTTQNLYIEGDNLDALKLLRNTYAGKVDICYIDPPYNTGGDLIYRDRFASKASEFVMESNYFDELGMRMVKNLDTSGAFHSDWCSMVFSRLLLVRDLLSEDGVIFISIDEVECDNLRKIADEVFGANNFIAGLVWSGGRKNDSQFVSVSHEYVLCYAKSVQALKDSKVEWREKKQGLDKIYNKYFFLVEQYGDNYAAIEADLKSWFKSLPDDDPAKRHSHYSCVDSRGIFFPGDISWPGGGGPRYEVFHPVTGRPVTIPSRGWLFSSSERMQEVIDAGLVQFGPDETKVPCYKRYLRDHEYIAPYSVIYRDGRRASKRLAKLMGGKVFDNPKDEEIIGKLISMTQKENSLVIDFFAGSGTTAQSVMSLNAQDGGKRRWILVQIPENLDVNLAGATKQSSKKVLEAAIKLCDALGDQHVITNVSKERIRRAGKKIAEEVEEANKQLKLGEEPKQVPDIGFRVLKIDSSNFKDVSAEPDELDQTTIMGLADNLKPGRTSDDLLFQVMPQFQIPLSAKIERLEMECATVFSVDGGNLVACFDSQVSTDVITAMAKMHPNYAVMRDASFSGDAVVANFGELFKTYSPATITRVI